MKGAFLLDTPLLALKFDSFSQLLHFKQTTYKPWHDRKGGGDSVLKDLNDESKAGNIINIKTPKTATTNFAEALRLKTPLL